MKNLGWLLLVMPTWAQSSQSLDRQAILAMAGAFVVDFHFEETVPFELGYTRKPDKDAAGLEQVFVVEDSERRISLQHVLQTPHGIVKHWRQDWVYEPEFLWEYKRDTTWKKRTLSLGERAGLWVQRVFQVDDSPRYEALGRWEHLGNLSQWTSAATRRPLPRREYTTRQDYNVLVAINRHALTPTGWVHEQDNYKLREEKNGTHVIAREYGLNRYDHTGPGRLAEAVSWWEEHQVAWRDVRAVWDELFSSQEMLELAKVVAEKPLHRHLSRLVSEQVKRKDYQSERMRRETRALIERFQEIPVKSAMIGL